MMSNGLSRLYARHSQSLKCKGRWLLSSKRTLFLHLHACSTYDAEFVSVWEISWHHWLYSFCKISNHTTNYSMEYISDQQKYVHVTGYKDCDCIRVPSFTRSSRRWFAGIQPIRNFRKQVKHQSLKVPRESGDLWLVTLPLLCPTRCRGLLGIRRACSDLHYLLTRENSATVNFFFFHFFFQ